MQRNEMPTVRHRYRDSAESGCSVSLVVSVPRCPRRRNVPHPPKGCPQLQAIATRFHRQANPLRRIEKKMTLSIVKKILEAADAGRRAYVKTGMRSINPWNPKLDSGERPYYFAWLQGFQTAAKAAGAKWVGENGYETNR